VRGRRLVDVCDMANVVMRAQVMRAQVEEKVGCYWLYWTLRPENGKRRIKKNGREIVV
jgi:hypothetical protein